MNLSYIYMDSPVGQLRLVASTEALVAVLWDCETPNRVKLATLVEDPEHPVLVATKVQLEQYFAGQRSCFDVPLDFAGTPFQKSVWQALLNGSYKKEMNMVGRYKQWLGMMSKHYPEAKSLWDEVKRVKPLEEITEKLKAAQHSAKNP
jgi:O6-methylguanine-DNA--protein-cysteine methyltransferase